MKKTIIIIPLVLLSLVGCTSTHKREQDEKLEFIEAIDSYCTGAGMKSVEYRGRYFKVECKD